MPVPDDHHLIVIAGPTAVGKTTRSIYLARQVDTHILSADSRQFYREMNIGTAKPTAEELKAVPHHFINSHSIHEYYSAGQFASDALELLKVLFREHPVVIVTGGSGLYLHALTEGLDPMPEIAATTRANLQETFEKEGLEVLLAELKEKDPVHYARIDRQNAARVIRALEVIRTAGQPFSELRKSMGTKRPFAIHKMALDLPRETLYARINQRVDEMLQNGLVAEARQLHPMRGLNALETVGYKELFDHFEGKYDLAEAIRLVKRNSRRYAKRQLTWLRRDLTMQWFSPKEKESMLAWIRSRTG